MPRIPTITKNLLIINILAFVGTLATRQQGSVDLNDLFGLHFFMASDFHVFQLVSYMFMHAGWEHLIFNMFMLWMFGTVVEHTWGSRRFIFYYIFCGVGAGILQEVAQFGWVYYMLYGQQPLGIGEAFSVMHQLASQLNGLTTVGASGALYALLLAFGMMFPNEKMFIIPIPVPIKAKWMVIGSIAVELTLGLAMPGGKVAHLAHLGGMVFGFFLIRYWQRHPGSQDVGMGGTGFFDQLRSRWEQHAASRRKGSTSEGSRRSVGGHAHRQSTGNADWDYNSRKKATQEETDRILDKIRKSGYDSLTREEKQTLFDQSKK